MRTQFLFIVLLLVGAASFAQTATDEVAIKKAIEDEVQYNRQRDLAKWLNCFVKSDDLVFGFFPGMARGYDSVANGLKTSIEKNPQPSKNTGVFSDYRIRQQGNTAFVTCIQIETAPDGTQTKWNKAEYLEKQNGEWKIVGNLFRDEPVTKTK